MIQPPRFPHHSTPENQGSASPRSRAIPLALAWTLGLAMLLRAGDPPSLSPEDRRAARKIYVAKCAKCHRFYDPTNYAEPDWQRWMKSMSTESKLKPEQEELLLRYLDAYRAGQLPGKPQDKTQ